MHALTQEEAPKVSNSLCRERVPCFPQSLEQQDPNKL